jgi:hypothetical protein
MKLGRAGSNKKDKKIAIKKKDDQIWHKNMSISNVEGWNWKKSIRKSIKNKRMELKTKFN